MDTLQVRNLTFTYPKSGTRAIDGIDFDIREGEVFGFLPERRGQRARRSESSSGCPGYGGDHLRGRPLHVRRRHQDIGVSFRDADLFQLTAMENLRFPAAVCAHLTSSR